jgi:hypothetical protein
MLAVSQLSDWAARFGSILLVAALIMIGVGAWLNRRGPQ